MDEARDVFHFSEIDWSAPVLRSRSQAAAIQVGFSRLIEGVTHGLLSVRQAKIILTALHQAVANLKDRTAIEDFAVTSNELRIPVPSGCRVPTSESRGW